MNRRITAGSQFNPTDYEKQIFFCPKTDNEVSCLEPQEFDHSEPLQCTQEAIPVARKLSTELNTCGMDDNSILYEVVYKVSHSTFNSFDTILINA